MILRELIALFSVNVDDKRVKQADVTLTGFIGKLRAFGGLIAGGAVAHALTSFYGDQIALGNQIGKTAAKLGVSTDALQELRFAAERTGVPINSLDMGLQRFVRRTAEAAQGTGEAKDTLRQLGIQLKDSSGAMRPAEALLGDVADALKNTTDQGERVRIAFKLFDSEGVALVNTLKNGGEALDEMRRIARDSGGILPAELVAQSEAATDELQLFHLSMQGIKSTLVLGFLPTIRWLVNGATSIAKKFTELTRGTYVLEAGLAAAAIAAAVLGRNSIRAAVAQLIAWAPIIATVGLVALGIAFVALLVDEVIKTFEGGDTIIRRFIDSLFGVGATEKSVQGQIGLWRALVAFVKLAGEKAREFGHWLGQAAVEADAKLMQLWTSIRQEAKDLFNSLPDWAQTAIDSVLSFFRDTLLGGVLSVFDKIKEGADALRFIFGDRILSLAFSGQGDSTAVVPLPPPPGLVLPSGNNSNTTNNRRMDLNVNVQATGSGAGDIASQTTQAIRDALSGVGDDIFGALSGEAS